MATNSAIEWTDDTWSPIIGCDRVSSGCDGCYAIREAWRHSHNPHPEVAAAFAGAVQKTGDRLDWTGQVNLLHRRLMQPLRGRKPRKIFVNSQSDLFHKNVPDDFIAQVWAVMCLARQHTYQILTKRPGRARSLLASHAFPAACEEALARLVGDETTPGLTRARREQYRSQSGSNFAEPLPHVHLGVSVEDQRTANIRIPVLLETPAAVRWISAEPLLGPVDLKQAVIPMGSQRGHGLTASFVHLGDCCTNQLHGINWLVVGGETGPKARPMHPDWVRYLRDQAAKAGVPFSFKQWGDWGPHTPVDGDGREVASARALAVDGTLYEPGSLQAGPDAGLVQVCKVGKKKAGRELDGITHDEFPAGVTA
ncbi:DUF5131 family protein [Streptomyces mirabilis]|uniref:DUF5131 family protein n=1 Tax=Streptomyces mirabilis TaxID=68239 RepID=UPI0033C68CFC